jgi:adenylate cyclase
VNSPTRSLLSKKAGVRAARIGFAAVWSIAAVLFIFFYPWFFNGLSSRLYDWKLSIRPVGVCTPEIIHLDVDDEAVATFGQWPWDRALSGRIVQRLAEYGARLIVFDIFYASAGRSTEGNQIFFEAIKQAGKVISATGIGELTDSEEKKLQVGQDRAQADALYDASWFLNVPPQLRLLRVVDLKGAAIPLLPIIESSKGVGHIAATPDPDGVYRKVALLLKLEDRCIPSSSLSTLLAHWNLSPDSITLTGDREIRINRGGDVIAIPVDDRGMMRIYWGKPWTSFKRYSVKDLLSEVPDKSRASRYKDKITIVAVTATGTTDFGATPLSINSPLNRLHSHALNTILTKCFIRNVPLFPWIAILLGLLAVAFPIATMRLSLKWEVVSIVSVCLLCFAIELLCFVFWSYDIALTAGLVIFFPAAGGALIIRAAALERQAAQAKRALERYVPPELIDDALAQGTGLDVSTRRQELTIVFVDMLGFSTLSDTVDVEYVTGFLKDFFGGMSRAILKHKGRVHEFLGDGFLAVFGDLIPLENHADAAFAAAMDMQRAMSAISAKWQNSGILEFQKGLWIRIGINTGMVFVGDLGSDRRLEYTVVGSAVNIASRLQSLAPPGGIMMTARTRALLKNPSPCQGPDCVQLKGIHRDMEVYTIFPTSINASPDAN